MTIRILWEFGAAFAGTIAFALLFHVPAKYYRYCGFIGGCGWVCYKLALLGATAPVATFLANVAVVFLSRFFAVREECPVTVFLISGIFPLVPGAGIYWTAYYIVTDDLGQAGDRGFATFKIAVAIVLSILLVFELPQKWFRVLNRGHIRQKEKK